MTKETEPMDEARQVSIVANTFLNTIGGGLGNFSNKVIADGLVTVLYSLLIISFKDDRKGFNSAIDKVAKTLKAQYRETHRDDKKD